MKKLLCVCLALCLLLMPFTVWAQADLPDGAIEKLDSDARDQGDNLPLPMAFDYQSIDPDVKIHDLGNLMTDEEEAALEEKAHSFIEAYHLDLAVVTVDCAETEQDAMRLADDIYDYAGGRGYGEDGLLLLIDMVNRKYWISTKGEAIQTFWDDDIEWMKAVLVPKLQHETPADTAEAFIFASEQVCTAKLADETGNKEVYTPHFNDYSGHWDAPKKLGSIFKKHIWIILAVAAVGALITGFAYYSAGKAKHRPVHAATEAGNYVSDPFTLDACDDDLIDRHVSRRARPQETSSSGGGGGGGGSSHSSSSGGSHGGGGGSF